MPVDFVSFLLLFLTQSLSSMTSLRSPAALILSFASAPRAFSTAGLSTKSVIADSSIGSEALSSSRFASTFFLLGLLGFGNDRLDLSRLARWFISSADLATNLRSSGALGETACFSSRLSARMRFRSQKRWMAGSDRKDGEGLSQPQGLSCSPAAVEAKAIGPTKNA